MLTDAEREQLADDLEAEMPDACRIVRRTQGPFDPDTGSHDTDIEQELFSGVCRVMPWTGGSGRPLVGEEAITQRMYDVTAPLTAVGIRSGDVVLVTASADQDLVGDFVVRNVAAAALGVQRRLVVEREE